MVVYICTKFHENIFDGIKVIERTRFSLEKNSKGHNSVNNNMEPRFLFSALRLMVVYSCTKFHEKILDGIKVIERTRFSLEKKKFKGTKM